MPEPRIIGLSRIGADTLIDEGVVIGYPAKATLLDRRDFSDSRGAVVGQHCIFRSGTVIYEDVLIGNDVQTAHNVVIREGTRIGNGCVFGNGTVIREAAILGRNVRLMESVVISEAAQIGNDVFMGPNVSFTAGRYMTGALEAAGRLKHEEAALLEGRFWKALQSLWRTTCALVQTRRSLPEFALEKDVLSPQALLFRMMSLLGTWWLAIQLASSNGP